MQDAVKENLCSVVNSIKLCVTKHNKEADAEQNHDSFKKIVCEWGAKLNEPAQLVSGSSQNYSPIILPN